MNKEFEEIKNDVAENKEPTTTVRELLRWFEAKRRRTGIVEKIQAELDAAKIITSPDFTKVWIDAEITFKRAIEVAAALPAAEGDSATDTPRDVNFLISMLRAANCGVICVNPEDSVEKAITLMLAHDFSQLAVMSNERALNGAISWKTIGKRLSQNNQIVRVREAMEAAYVVEDTEGLFNATKLIIDHEFIFVRSSADKKITGIVTATDLSEQFQFLSEPFLLIGKIESQARRLIGDKFTVEELRSICNENDVGRQERIKSVADLTFGEYIRLIQHPERWEKLGLRVDRMVFCDEMDKVREIRNDVMHFDPDGIDEQQYDQLRRFSRMISELEALSKSNAQERADA